jgi:hypothetical protein
MQSVRRPEPLSTSLPVGSGGYRAGCPGERNHGRSDIGERFRAMLGFQGAEQARF